MRACVTFKGCLCRGEASVQKKPSKSVHRELGEVLKNRHEGVLRHSTEVAPGVAQTQVHLRDVEPLSSFRVATE